MTIPEIYFQIILLGSFNSCLTVADVALGFLRQERVVKGQAEAGLVVKVFVPVSPGL